jgi:CRP/FNR family cyclic AMP-dependent transcriptional regulator
MFQGVDRAVVLSLMEQLQPVDFLAGSTVFAQGDSGDRVYFVASGKVKITRRSPGGRDFILAVLGPSDMFGLQSVLDPGPRTSNAISLTPVQACWTDQTTMCAWIAEQPQIAEQLLRVLARRLRRANTNVADLTFADVPERVTKQLLRLAQRFGIREHDAIHVPHDLTPEELAHLVGASPTATTKVLADLAHRGWIRLQQVRRRYRAA